MKAHEKPTKIIKFYRCLEKDMKDIYINSIVALKGVNVLHQYIIEGPIQVVSPPQQSNLPYRIISDIRNSWNVIKNSKKSSTADPYRTQRICELILLYSDAIKLKISIIKRYSKELEGSWALTPLFNRFEGMDVDSETTPIPPALLKEMLGLWKSLTNIHVL